MISRQIRLTIPCASISTTRAVLANNKQQMAKKGALRNRKKKQDEEEVAQEEIRVTIPAMPKEEIYMPQPVYKLDQFTADCMKAENIGKPLEMPKQYIDNINTTFGLPVTLQREFSFFRKPSFMLRKSTVEIKNLIADQLAIPDAKDRRRIHITGTRGCGKTAQMIQLMNYHSMNNWVTMHMPTFLWFLSGEYPFQYNQQTKLYDQPEATLAFLEYFEKQNAHVIDKIPLQHSDSGHKLGKDGVDNLRSLLKQKKERPVDVFNALFDELCGQGGVPVLVGVDMENALYHSTLYRDKQSNQLYPESFSFAKQFLSLLNGKRALANGVVVSSTSEYIVSKELVKQTLKASEEMAKSSNAIQYKMENFDLEETQNLLKYHARTGLVPREVICDQYVKKSFVMTGGNGAQLFQMAIERPLL